MRVFFGVLLAALAFPALANASQFRTDHVAVRGG